MCYEFRLLFFIFFRKPTKSKILKCLGVLNCKLFINTLYPPSFTLCDSNSFSEAHKHFSPFLSSGSIHNHQTVIFSKVVFDAYVLFFDAHMLFFDMKSHGHCPNIVRYTHLTNEYCVICGLRYASTDV